MLDRLYKRRASQPIIMIRNYEQGELNKANQMRRTKRGERNEQNRRN